MSIVDVNKIISATAEKRIHNAYNSMKENYNEVTAQGFKDVYSAESVVDVFEHSRLIFSEPMYGCDFYESMISNAVVPFSRLRDEYDKVKNYFTENSDNMGEIQKQKYENILHVLESRISESAKTATYAQFIKESIDSTFEDELMEAMYAYTTSEEKDATKVNEIMERVADPLVYFVYAPYVMESLSENNDESTVSSYAEKYVESCEINDDLNTWSHYVDKVLCCNNLGCDKSYTEAVSCVPRNERFIFKHYMESNLHDVLEKMNELTVDKSDVVYSTSVSAVNNIFADMMESEACKEENDESKTFADTMRAIALESSLNILVSEYQFAGNDKATANGYTIISESGKSLSEAYDEMITSYETLSHYTEASEDEDVDDLIDEDDDLDAVRGSNGKKPQAPKPKNLANKVQNKAMDKEAQYYKKKSIAKQKGQEIGNAVRAVGRVPMDILKNIKGMIRKLDEADDERRKRYLSEPGFRKKAFHNLRLAILYGTSATVGLATLPITMMARHYSKMKNRRMRNELMVELNTEIKICEEKISDANANGDTHEKYRLMRIKAKLENELVRVKTNSKYI